MNRRQFLFAAAAAAPLAAAERTQMGVATTCYLSFRRPRDTYEFLEHCHSNGAGGIQASLSSTDPAFLKKLRARLEQTGMYIEVMSGLPRGDAAAFEQTVVAAKEVNALCLRAACLGGRRYETFKTMEEWKKFVADSKSAIERALPIVARHKMRLALENHKDWTLDEMVPLIRGASSEYLGVCLDTGNNISLLDDPMAMTEALAPYAFSTHIKDMGVEPYEDGFLLSEVPFGEGYLDIKKIMDIIRRVQPATRMTLEMITRNPLKIPCLTPGYWATFPERSGRHLAHTLSTVRQKAARQPLPRVDHLDKEAQLRLEEDNVRQCLAYSRTNLGV